MLVSDFLPPLDEGKIADYLGIGAFAGAMALSGANAAKEVSDKLSSPPAQTASVSVKLDDPKAAQTPPQRLHRKKLSDVDLLALTMWGEARNHGEAGMRAVGHVIVNRLHSDRDFGDSIKEVVLKRKAFSCWNANDPNRAAMREIEKLDERSPDYQRWKLARRIAKQILHGHSHDPTRGALFYHTDDIKPGWAKDVKPISVVADHVFYKQDSKA